MKDLERYPISELVRRSGTPPATIHHYRRLGLLPAPRRAARNRFLYDARHLERIRLIRLLRKRRRLPLRVIRRILPDLAEMEEDQAFRPEMWDRVLAPHLRRGRGRSPRDRLLGAAEEAFSRRGYAEVRVEDICRSARVAKGSFYRHFRAKEELFLAAADASARQVADAFGSSLGSDAHPEPRAVEVLAELLAPRLPLFLDLLARGLQGRPGHPAAAGVLLRRLAERVGAHLRPGGAKAGRRVLERAVGTVVWSLTRRESSGVSRSAV